MATRQNKMLWLEMLKSARKTSLIQDGKRKIHYTFPDSRELAEEYDFKSGNLLVRKWKSKTTLGAEKKWEFEIGEDISSAGAFDTTYIVENRSNSLHDFTEGKKFGKIGYELSYQEILSAPIFVRKDTKEAFQWRIRNLPYSIDVYEVTIDEEKRHIVIRTKNKKYYKKYPIPDMVRNQLPLDNKAISIAHANNTLVIKYKKPALILEQERLILKELEKNKTPKEGDIECNPS